MEVTRNGGTATSDSREQKIKNQMLSCVLAFLQSMYKHPAGKRLSACLRGLFRKNYSKFRLNKISGISRQKIGKTDNKKGTS